MSEVEHWLHSLGAGALYRYFVEDGFTTLDDVRTMRQSDIDAIVDRNGFMVILNEGIDMLNNSGYGSRSYSVPPPRAVSFIGEQKQSAQESREELLNRYESAIPRGTSVSRTLARQAKSRSRHLRGASAYPGLGRASAERYVPTNASDEYESLVNETRRARSVAYNQRADAITAAENAIVDRQKQRQLRARSGKDMLCNIKGKLADN
jgi:hypothetical protein